MTRPETISELERLRAQQEAILSSETAKARRAAHAIDLAQTEILALDARLDEMRKQQEQQS